MKIERKKLILIIAALVTVGFTVLVIVLSTFTKTTDTSVPTPTPTAATSTPTDESTVSAPIGNSDDPEAPPESIYENDYSKDTGYVRLPEGFDGSQPAGTVYDETWSSQKFYSLLCELSNKQTITTKALQPLKDYLADLALVQSPNSSSMTATGNRYLKIYEGREGERTDGSVQTELSTYCNMAPED